MEDREREPIAAVREIITEIVRILPHKPIDSSEAEDKIREIIEVVREQDREALRAKLNPLLAKGGEIDSLFREMGIGVLPKETRQPINRVKRKLKRRLRQIGESI